MNQIYIVLHVFYCFSTFIFLFTSPSFQIRVCFPFSYLFLGSLWFATFLSSQQCMWFRKQRALTVFQYCRDCWTQRERLPVAQRRIWCKGSCLWCPSARWCLKADRMGWMECAGNPWNCDVFHKKTSRTESIRSVAWNTPPRCIRPFVHRWNGGPLALSVPKAGCPCHGRRALQLSAWCLVASKGIMQDGTFACGFPYHADSHRQSWESGVSLWMV